MSSTESSKADLSNPRVARRDKFNRIVQKGIDPWGSRFDDRQFISDVRNRSGEIQFQTDAGSVLPMPDFADPDLDYRQWKADHGPGTEIGPQVRVAGRIMFSRPTGKLIFLNVKDWTGVIQIFVGMKQVGESDFELAKLFDLGDLIGVDGRLGRTNTGELTVFAERLHFHSKMLELPPEKHAGLHDPDLKQRMRYADLAFNEGTLDVFLNRTKIIKSVRKTLDDQRFCEVEGPTLHAIAGGAAAKPFVTHHNALGRQLFLRIALELHLKRLLVGGVERVYELGRVYRNEGLSVRHNPEFTMLEAYQAYGDYLTIMDLTEQIICDAIAALDGVFQRPFGDKLVDYTPPFQRRTYADLFAERTGVDPTDADAVAELAQRIGIDVQDKHPDVIKSEVFEAKVEDALEGPIFVLDYPASICPLTKRKAGAPEIAERFELFVCGMEVANAYTELNDPDLQEELFRTQLAGMSEEESMAHLDLDFVRALRHAMPPAGGLGIGIDRLVMLLTGQRSIRDVILFPVLRPESGQAERPES